MQTKDPNANVLLIGPFSPPVNGVSFANDILLKNFCTQKMRIETVNTSTSTLSSNQGSKFSKRKAFSFLHIYLEIYKVFYTQLLYVTPGQTFFGILKYSPFFLSAIILNKPYIIHVHGNYLGREYKTLRGIKRKIVHYLLSNASAGIVLSKSLRENFSGILPADKIFVVENFVENEIYKIKKLIKKKDKPRILYLSNLMLEKGILELLDALVILKSNNIDFHAILAGAIEDDLKGEIDKRLKVLGDRVEYVGTVSGPNKIMKFLDANIFILPTYYKMEGQPISLLEGLATGNIIITTNHAGIPDIIGQSNGYLIKPKSAHAIAECIEKISIDLGEQIERFSNNNIQYAISNFTEKKFSENILYVINQSLKD